MDEGGGPAAAAPTAATKAESKSAIWLRKVSPLKLVKSAGRRRYRRPVGNVLNPAGAIDRSMGRRVRQHREYPHGGRGDSQGGAHVDSVRWYCGTVKETKLTPRPAAALTLTGRLPARFPHLADDDGNRGSAASGVRRDPDGWPHPG